MTFITKLKKSKVLITSLLLCFCLITQTTSSVAANKKYMNNDWRSMPFIEMMVVMMKAMNHVLGGNNSFTGLNSLPYSPAFVPGMTNGMGGLGALNQFPMSPAGMNSLPLNSMVNPLVDSFQPGQGTSNFNRNRFQKKNSGGNFWDPDSGTGSPNSYNANSIAMIDDQSLNGIWQALTGDVIAIYNDNRFLWSDGGARNIAGHLAIKGNNLIAYVPAKKITLYFQFYMEPGQFIVRDQNARIYTFKRIH